MKKKILILISIFSLTACYSTSPLTFKGNTAHWQIEMDAKKTSGNNQKIIVTYKYTGSLSQLKKYNHLELSFKTLNKSGGQTISSKNGLNKKQYAVTISGNGSQITKNTIPTVTIVLGENGQTETAKLALK